MWERYKYYRNYKNYMKTTTIALRQDLKEELQEFGQKGETYSDILFRLLKSAKERQLQDMLMDDSGTIPIEKAIIDAKRKWQ